MRSQRLRKINSDVSHHSQAQSRYLDRSRLSKHIYESDLLSSSPEAGEAGVKRSRVGLAGQGLCRLAMPRSSVPTTVHLTFAPRPAG